MTPRIFASALGLVLGLGLPLAGYVIGYVAWYRDHRMGRWMVVASCRSTGAIDLLTMGRDGMQPIDWCFIPAAGAEALYHGAQLTIPGATGAAPRALVSARR